MVRRGLERLSVEVGQDVSERYLEEVVRRLEGFSARQIDKFIYSVHDEVLARQGESHGEAWVDEDVVEYVLEQSLREKRIRNSWFV